MFFITQLTIENKIHPATPVTFYSVRNRVVQLPYLSRNTPNGPFYCSLQHFRRWYFHFIKSNEDAIIELEQ